MAVHARMPTAMRMPSTGLWHVEGVSAPGLCVEFARGRGDALCER